MYDLEAAEQPIKVIGSNKKNYVFITFQRLLNLYSLCNTKI